jgi:hypothetical protein
MKILFLKKGVLLTLIVLFLSIILTGCIEIIPVPPTNTGTVKIELNGIGNYTYDIKIDGETKFSDVQSGTYTLYDIPVGYHDFEAVDTMGASFGSDSERKYISAGTINYVYLYPDAPSPKTGTLKVAIMDDPGWPYEVYLGGNQNSGEYLGKTSGSSISGQNSATFTGIPTGSQTIFVISEDGEFSKYRYPIIVAGETVTVNIYVKS